MVRFEKAERMIAMAEQGRTIGPRATPPLMTFDEQFALEEQRHLKFAELSAAEQAQLEAERADMWGQIPDHLQAKARKMAGH